MHPEVRSRASGSWARKWRRYERRWPGHVPRKGWMAADAANYFCCGFRGRQDKIGLVGLAAVCFIHCHRWCYETAVWIWRYASAWRCFQCVRCQRREIAFWRCTWCGTCSPASAELECTTNDCNKMREISGHRRWLIVSWKTTCLSLRCWNPAYVLGLNRHCDFDGFFGWLLLTLGKHYVRLIPVGLAMIIGGITSCPEGWTMFSGSNANRPCEGW
jgi:hypothetical protein